MIVIGTLCATNGAGCATPTRYIRSVTWENQRRRRAAGYCCSHRTGGVQSQMDYGEGTDPPFFLLQESQALHRFCIVNVVVVMKESDYLRPLPLNCAADVLAWHPTSVS